MTFLPRTRHSAGGGSSSSSTMAAGRRADAASSPSAVTGFGGGGGPYGVSRVSTTSNGPGYVSGRRKSRYPQPLRMVLQNMEGERTFRGEWAKGNPIIVEGVGGRLRERWTPEHLSTLHGHLEVRLITRGRTKKAHS